ncbi:MAG: hypothetical protein ACP5N1_05010 [Candidatus Woesearchaeota archaeon]
MNEYANEIGLKPFYIEFGPEFTRLMNEKNRPIEFPHLIDTSKYMPLGNALTVLGAIMPPTGSIAEIVHHMHYHCGIPKGGNIQIIGGARGLNLEGIPSMDELIKGLENNGDMPEAYVITRDIYRAAYKLDANIITGGTQSGIMALFSSLWLADQIINEDILKVAKKKSELLDIPLKNIINSKSPSLIHIVPQSAVIYPGNENVNYTEWPWPLAPSSCVFIVSGENGWGAEGKTLEKSAYVTSFIPQADAAISSLPFDFNKYRQQRISIIVNGGYLSLIEAKNAVEAYQPSKILALEGTGRFADLLATTIKNNYNIPNEDHAIWKQPGILEDYGKANFAIEFDGFINTLKKYHISGKNIAHVFRSGNEGLTSKIESIMNGSRM